MSDAANPPGGYFVGRPLNHEEQQAPRPVDEKNAVKAQVPGYYSGHPARTRPAAAVEQKKEPGFFAKCCVCFSGGGNAN